MDAASLDRSSTVPLHVQLAERLRQRIISGGQRPGDRLEGEKDLAARTGLSLVTVRSALGLLQRDGWVLKRQGLGTFVCNPIEQDLTSLRTTSEVVRAQGVATTVRLLSFGQVRAPKAVTQALGLAAGERLLRIERLHSDAESSIAVIRSFLPLMAAAEAELLVRDGSVTTIELWERRLGVTIKGALHQIHAEPATATLAEALGIAPGSPVLTLDRTSYADDGRAVEYVSSHYNWRRYRFSVVLPRVSLT